MKMTNNSLRKQKGFGALEVMIALLIGAIVIIGAVFWYQKLRSTSDNNDELQNLATIISNVRLLRTTSGYGTSGTDLVPILINADGVPGGMSVSGTTISNSFGTVTISSTGSGFAVGYSAVPASNCIFLATKASGSGISTKLNGGTAISGEVTPTAANTGCSTASNSMTWTTR